MASFSKPFEHIPTRLQQELLRGEDKQIQELEPYSPSSSITYWSTESAGNQLGVGRNSSHKSSQCRLLAWVAITRNYHPSITPAERCTCPMVDCEYQFLSPEDMHKHLQNSPCLSKSTYRCFENRELVRVGKCDSDGCHELKGRFVSAVNSSIESVKRHLSRRRSRSPQLSQSGLGKETSLREEYFMQSPDDLVQYKELASNPYIELPVDGHMRPAEIGPSFTNPSPTEYGMGAQFMSSELHKATAPYEGRKQYQPASASSNKKLDSISPLSPGLYGFAENSSQSSSHTGESVPSSIHAEATTYNQTGLAELCANDILENHKHHQNHSSWWMPSPVTTEQSAPEVHEMPATYFYQSFRHAPQPAAPPILSNEYSEKMVVDNFTSVWTNSLPEITYDHRRFVPRMDSNSSSESRIGPSTFSTFSTISTSQSSMNSYDSSPGRFDDTQTSQMFFPEDDSVMFEEPESMETSEDCSQFGSGPRRFDTAGVSIDNYVEPGSYLSPAILNRCKLPTQQRVPERGALSSSLFHAQASPTISKDTSNDIPSPSSTANSPPPAPPHFPPSSSPSASFNPPLFPGKASCRYCGRMFDMSNRSRHEKACKQNPDHASVPRFACHYPGCPSTFSRKDNLAQHQRREEHFMNVELKICLTPAHGSQVLDLAMALERQQCQSGFGNAITELP